MLHRPYCLMKTHSTFLHLDLPLMKSYYSFPLTSQYVTVKTLTLLPCFLYPLMGRPMTVSLTLDRSLPPGAAVGSDELESGKQLCELSWWGIYADDYGPVSSAFLGLRSHSGNASWAYRWLHFQVPKVLASFLPHPSEPPPRSFSPEHPYGGLGANERHCGPQEAPRCLAAPSPSLQGGLKWCWTWCRDWL